MQYTKYLIGAALVVLVVGIGYAWGQAGNDATQAQGELSVSEPHYDFGTVGLDVVSHSYEVKNTGPGPVTITKVATSCGCTVAQLKVNGATSQPYGMDHGQLPRADVTLAPGETIEVIASYNPLAHGLQRAAGTFDRTVYLKTENPRDEYELTFRVTVDPDFKPAPAAPQVRFDRAEHDFGQITRTDGVVFTTFTVYNDGAETLLVSRVATSCGCTSGELARTDIAPNSSTELTVSFDPNFHDEPQGKLERTVTLFTNAPEAPEARVTIYAEIIE